MKETNTSAKFKIVYFATPAFAIPTLELLQHHPLVDLLLVVSMPDRPAGRGQSLQSPAIIEYCKKEKLTYLQTENINTCPEFQNIVQSSRPDLFIVLAFAQFLKKNILAIPQLGCFNIHTSILPKYRGAAPIQYALLNNDSSTGVSIQKMVAKMDAGDIVHFKEQVIYPYDCFESLSLKLQNLASLALAEFIDIIYQGALHPRPQNENQVTFAPTIQKNHGYIDFKNCTIQQLTNLSRAFSLWPGVFFYLNDKRVKIISFEVVSSLSLPPSEAQLKFQQIFIGLQDGTIHLKQLQIEGKGVVSDQNFLRGFRGEFKITEKIV